MSENNNQIVTFGCRLNIYESQIIKDNVEKSGLKDCIVVNTCAVTNEAEKQALQAIRKLKRENPESRIIVTGCGAQLHPELFASMPEVERILGNQEKMQASSYNFDIESEKVVVNDIMQVTEGASHLVHHFDKNTRAFIEIQNGCNHRCTFCIIPFARGNNRSSTIAQIIDQVKILVAKGYKEVIFTGVDITDYGKDLPGTPNLASLIKRLLTLVPDLPRLRLSSIDVAEVDEELFGLMANEKRLMPHFHISMQAGDNMILKRMKRRHNREKILEFCHNLRALRPEVSFGADIIAGFPTETDEMFLNTYNLISEAQIQFTHVFPYSPRAGTPAAKMPQVDNATKKARAKLLREAGALELNKFLNKMVGKHSNILLESKDFGHSENFIPIKFNEPFDTNNQIILSEFVSVADNKIIGRRI